MAETSYPLQVVLGLVDKLSKPWSETLEHLANTENRWVAGAARLGHIVLEQAVDVVKEAFHSGEEIERSINRIRATAHGAELELLEDRQALVRIGRETLAGTHEAAKAVDVLAHSGNDLAAAFLEATPALQLADVAQMDVTASARLLDRQLDAYGLTAEHAAEAADLLARTSLKLGETIPATAEAFSALAPIARVLHIPLETVAEMLLALHEKGLPAATAATQVRVALSALNKRGATDADGILRIGKALDTMREKGITGAQVLQALGQRGGVGLAGLLEAGSEGLAHQGDELQRVNGLLEQHAEQNRGSVGATKELANEWQNFLDVIGNEETLDNVAKVLGVIADAIEGIASGVNKVFKAAESAEGPLAKFLYDWKFGGTVTDRSSNPKVQAIMDAADKKYGPVDWDKAAAAMRDRPEHGETKKSDVTIRLKNFPKGTTVEQSGDVDVQTDLGLAMPSAGGH